MKKGAYCLAEKSEFSITILRRRLLAVCLSICFLFLMLAGRFFYIQVIWGDDLVYRAVDQWTREIPVVAQRGEIVDRNGVVLAGNESSYSVFVRRNAVKDREQTCALLAELLELDKDALLNKLSVSNVSELTVAKHVSKEAVERLAQYSIQGVYYARDNTRVYPYHDLLCQVLGFTATDNSGVSGLEQYYDSFLAGTNGELLYETDLVGIEIEDSVAIYRAAVDGMNLRLTVDYDIQALAESVMAKVYREYAPASAECIVMDPNTFEILAMVNYPGYDLNEVPREDEHLNELSRNRLVSNIYEPGSTFKVVTAAADVEEWLRGNSNAFSTSHIFSSSRTRSVDSTTIKCWSDHNNGKHSNQTLADALNNSCNPCFTDIALALGKETFYDYLSAFHFGNVTGLDFSGEALGMLLPETALRDCDLARIGFGQTIAVTAIQLAAAVSAVVNGGYYYVPHLVKEIYSDDGKTSEVIVPTLLNRPVSEEASALMRTMLEGVVAEGSGKKAYLEGYRVGGKTGTAQKYEDGHIAAGKYVSSFVGFFPADRPEYLTLVIIDEPQGAYYGSAVAAPCAGELFSGIIQIKEIQPGG